MKDTHFRRRRNVIRCNIVILCNVIEQSRITSRWDNKNICKFSQKCPFKFNWQSYATGTYNTAECPDAIHEIKATIKLPDTKTDHRNEAGRNRQRESTTKTYNSKHRSRTGLVHALPRKNKGFRHLFSSHSPAHMQKRHYLVSHTFLLPMFVCWRCCKDPENFFKVILLYRAGGHCYCR